MRWAKEALQVLEMDLSVEVGSAPDAVWRIVGDFNGMPAWHPLVRASVLEPAEGGVGRRVTIGGDRAGYRELTERLVSFDASAREYAYTIIAGPVPFTDYVGRFHVVPAGTGRCTVEYRGRYKPGAGRSESEASERIRTFYQAAFYNLPSSSERSAVGAARRIPGPGIDVWRNRRGERKSTGTRSRV